MIRVVTGEPEDVLRSFDIRNCMIAIDSSYNVWSVSNFDELMAEKRVQLNIEHFNVGSISRLTKYMYRFPNIDPECKSLLKDFIHENMKDINREWHRDDSKYVKENKMQHMAFIATTRLVMESNYIDGSDVVPFLFLLRNNISSYAFLSIKERRRVNLREEAVRTVGNMLSPASINRWNNGWEKPTIVQLLAYYIKRRNAEKNESREALKIAEKWLEE
jgi:hypothetical protein